MFKTLNLYFKIIPLTSMVYYLNSKFKSWFSTQIMELHGVINLPLLTYLHKTIVPIENLSVSFLKVRTHFLWMMYNSQLCVYCLSNAISLYTNQALNGKFVYALWRSILCLQTYTCLKTFYIRHLGFPLSPFLPSHSLSSYYASLHTSLFSFKL